jgi:hypothetical protein
MHMTGAERIAVDPLTGTVKMGMVGPAKLTGTRRS